MALRSASVGQVASQYTREKGKSQRSQDSTKTAMEAAAQAVVTEDLDVMSSQEDAGAVVFLFPPKGHLGWSFESLWLACKLWLLDLFSPANDQHAKKKVHTWTDAIFCSPANTIHSSESINSSRQIVPPRKPFRGNIRHEGCGI